MAPHRKWTAQRSETHHWHGRRAQRLILLAAMLLVGGTPLLTSCGSSSARVVLPQLAYPTAPTATPSATNTPAVAHTRVAATPATARAECRPITAADYHAMDGQPMASAVDLCVCPPDGRLGWPGLMLKNIGPVTLTWTVSVYNRTGVVYSVHPTGGTLAVGATSELFIDGPASADASNDFEVGVTWGPDVHDGFGTVFGVCW